LIKESTVPFDSLPSPAITVLQTGRTLIETRGLAKGKAEDIEGRLCAVGGITHQSRYLVPGMDEAFEYLARAIGVLPEGIAIWSDSHTQDDVLSAYDKAIELASSELVLSTDEQRIR
jgi:hypothetical protein